MHFSKNLIFSKHRNSSGIPVPSIRHSPEYPSDSSSATLCSEFVPRDGPCAGSGGPEFPYPWIGIFPEMSDGHPCMALKGNVLINRFGSLKHSANLICCLWGTPSREQPPQCCQEHQPWLGMFEGCAALGFCQRHCWLWSLCPGTGSDLPPTNGVGSRSGSTSPFPAELKIPESHLSTERISILEQWGKGLLLESKEDVGAARYHSLQLHSCLKFWIKT